MLCFMFFLLALVITECLLDSYIMYWSAKIFVRYIAVLCLSKPFPLIEGIEQTSNEKSLN